jgi:hypothetical protein
MKPRIHLQFMSPDGDHDRVFGHARSVVHQGVAQLARVYGTLRRLHGIGTSKQRTFKGLPAATVEHFLAPFRPRAGGC